MDTFKLIEMEEMCKRCPHRDLEISDSLHSFNDVIDPIIWCRHENACKRIKLLYEEPIRD